MPKFQFYKSRFEDKRPPLTRAALHNATVTVKLLVKHEMFYKQTCFLVIGTICDITK